MNVKRFTARTARDALALVRQALGQDAVVLSTKPCEAGVEVLAMAPEGLQQIERAALHAPLVAQAPLAAAPLPAAPSGGAAAPARARTPPRIEPQLGAGLRHEIDQDVEQLAMSTLSFQDYVRERMLKRRQAALEPASPPPPEPAPSPPTHEPVRLVARREAAAAAQPVRREPPVLREELRVPPPVLRDELRVGTGARHDQRRAASTLAPVLADSGSARRDQVEMMTELRSMRGLIEQRFGALAFMEKLQRQPRLATLTQRLLEQGFSPSLARKLVESLPADVDALGWAIGVLERNLATGEHEPALEELGGVYALIGSTGVGKTTSTAKLAAAFAARHGAAHLGLITLDAYRVGAHEQLRAYGRILGVPVHTAHDRASLEDLLELLAGKKMVLIDTAGVAQRDSRTVELLEMLSHRSINKLLAINASAQGETIEDVLLAYGAATCRGVILSKIDEAVKLGPALDALIRHKLKVLAVGNGQRVPEDWHRLSAHALVQQALRSAPSPAWRLDAGEVNLVFAGPPPGFGGMAAALHA